MLVDELFLSEEPELESNAVAKLEELAIDFLSQLCHSELLPDDDELSAEGENSYPEGSSSRACIRLEMADRTRTDPATGSFGVRFITYPKKMATGSAKQLAQLFGVINLTHEAIVEDVPATKRDIYYRDVPLFQNQKIVDTLVDDIAASVQLERSDLNVRATSKGIFCGSVFSIHLSAGGIINGNDSEASLIPVGEDVKTFNVDEELAWVLVVEKDAVFQTLCHLNASNHPLLPGKGLIITGKGYPDMATRHLVKTLSDFLPRTIPIVALVDGDPYGLDILSVYKYGSSRLRHENEKLAAGRIKWLGLLSSELSRLGIDKDALIPISRHDEKKAFSMLQRPRNVMPSEWRKELMYTLHNRRKAEIEILSSSKYSAHSPSSASSQYKDEGFRARHCPPLLQYLHLKLPQFITQPRSMPDKSGM